MQDGKEGNKRDSKVPFETIHVDHLGPFPSSSRRNKHIIVVVDGFTKCVFLKAVRTRDTKLVIEFMRDLFCTYGIHFAAVYQLR